MAFQGSLKELPLPDIIQLVSVSGKTGKFTLSRDEARGFIFLKNGRAYQAYVLGSEKEVTGKDAARFSTPWALMTTRL